MAAAPAPPTTAAAPAPARPFVTAPAAPARKTTAKVLEPRPTPRRISGAWVAVGLTALIVAGLLIRRFTGTGTEGSPATVATQDTVRPAGGTRTDSLKGEQTDTARTGTTDSARTGRPTEPEPPRPVAVARIELQPPQATIEVGKRLQLDARLLAAGGTPIADPREVAWKSSAPGVATVSGAGEVQGVAAGRATITATVEGRKATATMSVRAPAPEPAVRLPVATVGIQPETATVIVGRDASLAAIVRDSKGAALTDRPVAWTASPESVATISAGGRVLGRGPGVARIVAKAEASSGVAIVTVIAEPVASIRLSAPSGPLKPGESIQLVATGLAANGSTLDGRRVLWATSDSGVAAVAGGRVTAHSAGNAEISASIEGQKRAVTVTVSAPAAQERPPVADDPRRTAQEIGRVLEVFVDALNSRDTKRVKDAYPGMRPDEEARWRRLLEDRKTVTDLRATLQESGQPKVDGDAAESLIQIHLAMKVQGLTKPLDQKYRAVFARESGTWRLVQLEDR
jgi:uncharacterized protein YjdB